MLIIFNFNPSKTFAELRRRIIQFYLYVFINLLRYKNVWIEKKLGEEKSIGKEEVAKEN
jgi:hypothetical protein